MSRNLYVHLTRSASSSSLSPPGAQISTVYQRLITERKMWWLFLLLCRVKFTPASVCHKRESIPPYHHLPSPQSTFHTAHRRPWIKRVVPGYQFQQPDRNYFMRLADWLTFLFPRSRKIISNINFSNQNGSVYDAICGSHKPCHNWRRFTSDPVSCFTQKFHPGKGPGPGRVK